MATESSCPADSVPAGTSRGPHEGCGMRVPCDGDDGGSAAGMSWCLIDKSRSDPECTPAGANWDYCLPNANARALNLGGGLQLLTGSCESLTTEQDCTGTAMCAWDADGTGSCYDRGSCVERPGMWSYGLEEHEDSGAVRASMGGASSVLTLLLCLVAANWR